MKKILLLIIINLLFSCAVGPMPIDISNIGESETFSVKDSRPEMEKKQKSFSSNIFSEKYGIWRVKESATSPFPIRIFQHKAYEKFKSLEVAPDIEVLHFVTYSNMKAQLKRGAMGGLLGALSKNNDVNSRSRVIALEEFDFSEDDEYKRGLYTENENPNKASVFITYIIASVNGKIVGTRTISPAALEGDERAPYPVAINESISYFLDQF